MLTLCVTVLTTRGCRRFPVLTITTAIDGEEVVNAVDNRQHWEPSLATATTTPRNPRMLSSDVVRVFLVAVVACRATSLILYKILVEHVVSLYVVFDRILLKNW